MLSTPIVMESLDSPLLLGTAKFAIHALYTEFVGRCTWLFSIHMRSGTFPPKDRPTDRINLFKSESDVVLLA